MWVSFLNDPLLCQKHVNIDTSLVSYEVQEFIDDISKLFYRGYSIDEALGLLCDDAPRDSDSKKCVETLYALLSKQLADGVFRTPELGTKTSKIMHIWQSLCDVSYFSILEKGLVIGAFIVVIFLLYKIYSWLFALTAQTPSPSLIIDEKVSAKIGPEVLKKIDRPIENALCQAAEQTELPVQKSKSFSREKQKASAMASTQGNAQLVAPPVQSTEPPQPPSGEHNQVRESMLRPMLVCNIMDNRLEASIVRQAEHAKKIGLEPASIQYEEAPLDGGCEFSSITGRINAQVEYAKTIGLAPA